MEKEYKPIEATMTVSDISVVSNKKSNSVLHLTEDMHVYTEKRYNALQKFCMRFFFNIEVEDVRKYK